jgi:hypothetical protein
MRGKEKVPSSMHCGGENAQERDCPVFINSYYLLTLNSGVFYLHARKQKPGDGLINNPRFENRDPT